MISAITDFSSIKKAFSYQEYYDLVIYLSETHSTTGSETTEERIEATKLNAQRMKRIGKQFVLSEEIRNTLKNLKRNWEWIILAEAWCGDGAQCIPVIAKIAEASSSIELKIILRDENPEIMDAYLTNGGRAIPKLICINSETQEEIGTWGARPAAIQKMVKEFKAQNPGISHEEFVKNLHLWYAQDKGKSLEAEFSELLKQWSSQAGK